MTGTTGPAAQPAAKSFVVKSRTTHPVEYSTVEAASREEAIAKAIAAADEGDEIEVMDAKEDTSVSAEGPTGTTGTTGATGASGAAR